MILRNDIKSICSKLAKKYGLQFQLLNCYNLIDNYCRNNKVEPSKNNYHTENGNLFINNQYVGKIAVYEKVAYNSFWDVLENNIGYPDFV